MPASLDVPAAAAGHERGHVVVPVPHAVAHAAAEDDDGMVEQRAVAVRGGAQFVEEVREHLDVIAVNFGHLADPLLVPGVVRQLVMRVGDADFAIRAVTLFGPQHQGGDAR